MAFREDPTRDTIVAILVVGGAILAIYVWSGVYPESPIVVIESESMMHRDNETGYGRIGTIDIGDIVLVESVTAESIITWAQAEGQCPSCSMYGMAGDVIVYHPNDDPSRTPVIHRAMAYVQVLGTGANRIYRVEWPGGEPLSFNRSGIYIPELGFREPAYSRANGFKPAASGFITKGDNPFTNPFADQAVGISQIVEADWIIGRARAEIPWFGLMKLGLATEFNVDVQQAQANGWTRIGNAYAPTDLWTMLGIAIAVILFLPLGLDIRHARIERREFFRNEEAALAEGAPPRYVPPDEANFRSRAKAMFRDLAALFGPEDDDEDEGDEGDKAAAAKPDAGSKG